MDHKSGWPSGLRRQTQVIELQCNSHCENSGPQMWAWVQIPLLTTFFFIFFSLKKTFFSQKEEDALAGNRTPINCLEGNYADHYTTNAHACTVMSCLIVK